MTDLRKAYQVGKRLALVKFAEELASDSTEVEDLTSKLEDILGGSPVANTKSDILENIEERAGNASWGDKMELDTASNTGINV
tara:strand:- start:122 stop:370 length:249 start_codon:yes stop_codon:yes gene_type:complete